MNPYTPSSSQLFYGREKIFRTLLKNEEAGQSVVLIGGRRCGKTRLIERIQKYLQAKINKDSHSSGTWEVFVPDAMEPEPERCLPLHWPVLIDFQGMVFESFNQVLFYIGEAIAAGKPPVKELPPVPVADNITTSALEKWLKELDQSLQEANLGGPALLLDEIEELFDKQWHHDFMAFLRRLDDFSLKSRIWIVVVGSDGLDNYRHAKDGSPPLNTTRRMFLADLDYPARRRMSIEPFTKANRLPTPDDVLKEIDRIAAGNVWLLTLILEYLYQSDKITLTALEEAATLLLEQQDDIFHRWAKPLGEDGWQMYGQVASRGFVGAKHFKGSRGRSLRALLEYQALVHRRQMGDSEMGPELFRDWALEEGKIKEPFAPRPAPEPEMGILPPGHFQYDVAISYASPQRNSAKELADEMRKLGKQVFYDRDLGHELWGVDLAHFLPETYDRLARFAVLLISEDYVKRHWTMVEKAAALKKAIREGWDAVLLVYMDDTRLPDVPGSIVYMDLSKGDKTIAHVALALAARLNKQVEKDG